MRRWFVALGLIGLTATASAGEFELPTLRGSSPFVPQAPKYAQWSGFYVGGQAGYSLSSMNLAESFRTLSVFDSSNFFTAPLGSVANWAAFGKDTDRTSSYGGFAGYNMQWDDVILGIEINYDRTSLQGHALSSRCYSSTNLNCLPAITLGDGNQYNVTVAASASALITDYGSLRARAGWVVGDFLPYVTVGAALGRVVTTRTVTATGTPVAAGSGFATTAGDSATRFTPGFAAGAGVDFLLMRNVFVRAEYEYVKLHPVTDIKLKLDTFRAGLGLKF